MLHVCLSPCCSTHNVDVRVDDQVVIQQKALHARVIDVPDVQKLVYDHRKHVCVVLEAGLRDQGASLVLISLAMVFGKPMHHAFFSCTTSHGNGI